MGEWKPMRQSVPVVEVHGREWQWLAPLDLEVGDVIADFGQVKSIRDSGINRYLTNILDVEKCVSGIANIKLHVFGRKR